MLELSDWIWLGVVVLWAIFRILPRLFRARNAGGPKPKPELDPATADQERVGDIGPGPINPK